MGETDDQGKMHGAIAATHVWSVRSIGCRELLPAQRPSFDYAQDKSDLHGHHHQRQRRKADRAALVRSLPEAAGWSGLCL